MPEPFDPYREWLGIEVQNHPPSHYELLGLKLFEQDKARIVSSSNQTMAHARGSRPGPHLVQWQGLLDELKQAKACLTDAIKKAKYDAELRIELDKGQGESVLGESVRSSPPTGLTRSVTPSPSSNPWNPPQLDSETQEPVAAGATAEDPPTDQALVTPPPVTPPLAPAKSDSAWGDPQAPVAKTPGPATEPETTVSDSVPTDALTSWTKNASLSKLGMTGVAVGLGLLALSLILAWTDKTEDQAAQNSTTQDTEAPLPDQGANDNSEAGPADVAQTPAAPPEKLANKTARQRKTNAPPKPHPGPELVEPKPEPKLVEKEAQSEFKTIQTVDPKPAPKAVIQPEPKVEKKTAVIQPEPKVEKKTTESKSGPKERSAKSSERQDAAIAYFKKLEGNVRIDKRRSGKPVVELTLKDTKVTDAGLVHLKAFTKLQALFLGRTRVTDVGLVHLEGLTELQYLNLVRTGITDAGLVHLKGLTKLEHLSLKHTKVTDAGLVHLKGLSVLDLGGTKVSDAGLVHLIGLTRLIVLSLTDTKVTDAGLVHLKVFSRLQRLDLDGTKITNAGLVHLKGLTSLLYLNLKGTRVTQAAIKKLQRALPKCAIN